MAELTDAARKMLEGKNFCFLATLNRDASPQLTPMWVDTDGEHVLVNTAIGRLKQKNTKRDPRVAISLVEQTNPYSMLLVRGRVVDQITGPEAEAHIDKLAEKYTGAAKFTRYNPNEKRVILKIKPERVLARG